jgi:hypothetical protein
VSAFLIGSPSAAGYDRCVDLIVLDQSIDTTTPSGRLLFHMLAVIAEFERDLIRDGVMAGLRRAKAQGRLLGRPRRHHIGLAAARALVAEELSLRAVASVYAHIRWPFVGRSLSPRPSQNLSAKRPVTLRQSSLGAAVAGRHIGCGL